MYVYCMRQVSHPWLSCLYVMWAKSNGLTTHPDLHLENQPTTGALIFADQGAWSDGYRQRERYCFPCGSSESSDHRPDSIKALYGSAWKP